MTTYTPIPDALVAVGAKPFATTIQALRDNTLAIVEADASVPAILLPSVLLGTLTTTSGTTQTLSSLVLTPYKFLRVVVASVSGSTTATYLSIQTANAIVSANLGANAAQVWRGIVDIDLSTSAYAANIAVTFSSSNTSGTSTAYGGTCGITNATTSVSILAQGGGSFDAGSVLIYGMK